jgi:DNA topoisomerase-1
MAKSLVIVESPAKAKTINKYLGKNFIVKSSVGHVRDLPTSSSGTKKPPLKTAAELKKMTDKAKAAYRSARDKKALVARMGIDPENNWKAQYEILPGKEKVVSELQALAKDAPKIYLATDLDREGEAIAWHLREIIGGDESKYERVVFNEITKSAIKEAFSNPSKLNIEGVNAQQTRRFLDRVVGFMVSPLLWKKIARGLSAGRVQSVAVRLVVEREREIKVFIPEEFWQIHADLKTESGHAMRMEALKHKGKTLKIVNEKQATTAVTALNSSDYTVSANVKKPTQSRPSAPFITSTLQQAASTRLGYGVKKTMMTAQSLYEAGHITYMRTDSTSLSKDAVSACRDYISNEFGDKYLLDKPMVYGNKKGAQEAHEAIRPSDAQVTSKDLTAMKPDAQRLYDLIWRQFIACQMPPAKYDSTTVTVEAGDYELKAKGRVLVFDGWTKVQPAVRKKGEEEPTLPKLTVNDKMSLEAVVPAQHFTKPTARFNEASLVKELEKRGIGRPSTYATIISTIQDRGYVRQESRRFFAEKMGEIVTDRLVGNFEHLLSYDFTSIMESKLDSIAEGDLSWFNVLDEFYKDFTNRLSTAEMPPEEGGMMGNDMVMTDITCPNCSRKMGIRTATTGVFLGCEGYSLPAKEKCTQTINLVSGDEAISVDSEDAETDALRSKHRCPNCSTAMDSYLIDEDRKLHVCGNNPSCEGYEIEKGAFKIKGYEGPLLECDKCGSNMELINGRFGKFFGCTNDDCKNTRKLLKSGEPAPPKADPIPMPWLKCLKVEDTYILRDGAAGIFLAASQFPKNRETRPPLVEEILEVADKLDPKYAFLTKAPVEDSDGNKTTIRFSRKFKTQYVMTEVDGKATGWKAEYEKGKWEIYEKPKKAVKKPAKKPAKKAAKKTTKK